MYSSDTGRAVIGSDAHDFYRCEQCRRICTQPEMVAALGSGGSGCACPCGSLKYRPTNLPWWGWGLPRVWTFAIARIVELGPRGLLANLRADWRRRGESDVYVPPPPGCAR